MTGLPAVMMIYGSSLFAFEYDSKAVIIPFKSHTHKYMSNQNGLGINLTFLLNVLAKSRAVFPYCGNMNVLAVHELCLMFTLFLY